LESDIRSYSLQGVVGKRTALDIHVDGVAVDAGLNRRAILQLDPQIGTGAVFQLEMARVGRRQPQIALPARRQRVLHGRGKIEIHRLVVRRFGVGHIAGQHFAAIGAQIERSLVEIEIPGNLI